MTTAPRDSIPVIVDCDPGHDDVFALWLAAGHPAIDLRAVTTVGGNAPLEFTSLNARVALTVAGVTDVPVAAGAPGPLARPLRTAEWIHGKNGLGGPTLPEPAFALDPRTATDLMVDVLEAAAEPVTVIALGPITNVAVLLRDRPDAAARVREIVWMGGSTAGGNATPHAEFNAWVDPEALALVVGSGIPFTMVGLNVTHTALVTADVRARLAATGTRTAAFGDDLLDFFGRTNEEHFGLADGPLHDPVAVMAVAQPDAVRRVRTRLDVEVSDPVTAGATRVDESREPNALVATELNVERFWDAVREALAKLT
ncbi:nucleoside hydrolase [Microbacterium sp. NPDC019599]|uniref:nucleoside hydrolase n=1 Tax=Microbacterium sp. NPDC019599 TaxID=3154690 RepID=UPI00341122E6